MSDPDAVAAALARLVNGTATARHFEQDSAQEGPPSAERVVAEAEAAIDALPEASAFVAADGEQRLRRAVERSADDCLVERGRKVLAALERLRSATEPAGLENPAETRPPDGDHFHRGHTTLLKGAGVATE